LIFSANPQAEVRYSLAVPKTESRDPVNVPARARRHDDLYKELLAVVESGYFPESRGRLEVGWQNLEI